MDDEFQEFKKIITRPMDEWMNARYGRWPLILKSATIASFLLLLLERRWAATAMVAAAHSHNDTFYVKQNCIYNSDARIVHESFRAATHTIAQV